MGPRAPLDTGPREAWGHEGTDCIQPPGAACQPDPDASCPLPTQLGSCTRFSAVGPRSGPALPLEASGLMGGKPVSASHPTAQTTREPRIPPPVGSREGPPQGTSAPRTPGGARPRPHLMPVERVEQPALQEVQDLQGRVAGGCDQVVPRGVEGEGGHRSTVHCGGTSVRRLREPAAQRRPERRGSPTGLPRGVARPRERRLVPAEDGGQAAGVTGAQPGTALLRLSHHVGRSAQRNAVSARPLQGSIGHQEPREGGTEATADPAPKHRELATAGGQQVPEGEA